MLNLKTTGLTIAAVAACFTMAAQAAVITEWTFETSQPSLSNSTTIDGISAEVGTGTASAVHSDSRADYSNPDGNGTNESFNSNYWVTGNYYQFTTSTTGYNGLQLLFDQTSSSTGPTGFQVQYSTDGVSFNNLGTPYTVSSTGWSASSYNAADHFSYVLPAALDNQASIWIRLTATADGSSASGTSRVDNVIIQTIPEPATLALFGLGGLVMLKRRRSAA